MQGLIESPLSQPLPVKRNRHDNINVRNETRVARHPRGHGSSQRPARPVLELVNVLPQRPFELSYGERLIILGRGLSALSARMLRTVRERIRRFEGPAAARTDRALHRRKIRPTLGAEKRKRRSTEPWT